MINRNTIDGKKLLKSLGKQIVFKLFNGSTILIVKSKVDWTANKLANFQYKCTKSKEKVKKVK